MPPKTVTPNGKQRAQAIGSIAIADKTTEELENHFLGTLAVDTRKLCQTWDKKEGRNRTISERLVTQLVTAYQHGIQRYHTRTRLVVSVTKAEFQTILEGLASEERGIEALKQVVRLRGGEVCQNLTIVRI